MKTKRLYIILFTVITAALLSNYSMGYSSPSGDRQVAGLQPGTEVTWNPATQKASFVSTNVPYAQLGLPGFQNGPSSPEIIAAGYLQSTSDLFGMVDLEQELVLTKVDVDPLGMSHVKFEQVYQGIEVYAGGISVHIARDGSIRSANSGFIPGIRLSTVKPQITAESAAAAVAKNSPGGSHQEAPRLVVYVDGQRSSGDQARLAWLLDWQEASGPAAYRYAVDAVDGRLLDAVPLYLEERYRETYDAQHNMTLPGVLRRSENDGPVGDSDIDRIHDFAGLAYDYFFDTHSRDSFDNLGHKIVSTAHFGTNYLNAGWTGVNLQFIYGDGIVADDVVAHEFTHAVVQFTANMQYSWQSGALNESVADIFGAMIDREDWLMGEDLPDSIRSGSEALRDMANPARFGQPEHARDWVATCSDNQGVHINSGITNKAYYTIATSIGRDAAELIFFRALANYLDATSSLEDFRAAALQASRDLHGDGSAQYQAVLNGFNAVGLDGTWNPPANNCTCPATATLTGEANAADLLRNVYALRDQVLVSGPGPHWVQLYYDHQFEIARLLAADAGLRADALAGLRLFNPVILDLLDGRGGESVLITEEMVRSAERVVVELADSSRPETREVILSEWSRANPDRFVGWTAEAAWEQLRQEYAGQLIYISLISR